MKETINPTELAAMDAVRQKTRPELGKRSPRIDHIDHRRLTYFMIEDRIADYEAAGIERTLYVHASCCVHRRPQLNQSMAAIFVRKLIFAWPLDLLQI